MTYQEELNRLRTLSTSELNNEIAVFLGWNAIRYSKYGWMGLSPAGTEDRVPSYAFDQELALSLVKLMRDNYGMIVGLFTFPPALLTNSPNFSPWIVSIENAIKNWAARSESTSMSLAICMAVLQAKYYMEHEDEQEESPVSSSG